MCFDLLYVHCMHAVVLCVHWYNMTFNGSPPSDFCKYNEQNYNTLHTSRSELSAGVSPLRQIHRVRNFTY